MEENKTAIPQQEKEKRVFSEERFEFAVFVNDNLICKRNFRIFNFIENSMYTAEFKEVVDRAVQLIDNDLKSKSRVWLWYNHNSEFPEWCEETNAPLLEPWACTFKFVVYDNKTEVITKIWDGYAYPRIVRDNVDLTNKKVKITNKAGQTFVYDKDTFFASRDVFPFELEVLRGMIMDKSDVLLQITKRICEACSQSKDEAKDKTGRTVASDDRYISRYTISEDWGEGDNKRTYYYSLKAANKKVEKAWEKALADKTKAYLSGKL